MDRIEAMEQFVRVAENGSFSAVAQQLGVARSVVTRQVAALEAHLGTKLIARSTRSLSLTSAGADYLERCRVILNLVEEAEGGIAESRHAPRGPIRMSVPVSFGLRHLNPHLLRFAQRYPEVALDVEYVDRRSNLIEEGMDLSIRITGQLQPGDIARRLSSCRILVLAAPEYLARHGEPRHPAELLHHECLAYTGTAQPHSWPFEVDGRIVGFPIRPRLQANSGESLLDAAIAGFGIILTPSFIAADALASGSVRAILGAFATPPLDIYAMLPGNRHVPHRVRVLVDYLAEHLAGEPPWDRAAPPAPAHAGGGRRGNG